MQKSSIKICITGAAGNLAYSFLPMLCTGQVFGNRTTLHITLLDLAHKEYILKGIALELEDGAFPLVTKIEVGSDPKEMFRDCTMVVFMGGASRQPGQERRDLLNVNGTIFMEQGEALNEVAAADCKCLVVANPCNTNCYILQKYCPKLPKNNFTCLNRLDHNRAISQISRKLNVELGKIKKVTVWGNHSVYQYPDLSQAIIDGKTADELITDKDYAKKEFISIVQQRATYVLQQKKQSAVLSGAIAICDHIRDWFFGTPKEDWVSMGVISDGSYGVPEGLVFSFPVICDNFNYKIVEGLDLGDFGREKIKVAVDELVDEKDEVVESLLCQRRPSGGDY
jgi:malate dehydrogenase